MSAQLFRLADDLPPLQIPGLPQIERQAASLDIASTNDAAQLEASSLAGGKTRDQLKEAAEESEHRRGERFKDHFERIAIFGLYAGAVGLGFTAFIWLSQILIAEKYRWLTPAEISHLQTILTAGVLVSVIGNHFKKRMGPD